MSLELLLQAAEYIESREKHTEHGYASYLFPTSENAHLYKSKSCSKKLSGKRSSHNELEKCRRAYLRNCLNGLKELVPLDPNTYRHTTLGLLNKARMHVMNLEGNAKLLANKKDRLYQEQNILRHKLAALMVDGGDARVDNEVPCGTRPSPPEQAEMAAALLTPTASLLSRGFAGIMMGSGNGLELKSKEDGFASKTTPYFTYNLPKGLLPSSGSTTTTPAAMTLGQSAGVANLINNTKKGGRSSAFTNLNLAMLGIGGDAPTLGNLGSSNMISLLTTRNKQLQHQSDKSSPKKIRTDSESSYLSGYSSFSCGSVESSNSSNTADKSPPAIVTEDDNVKHQQQHTGIHFNQLNGGCQDATGGADASVTVSGSTLTVKDNYREESSLVDSEAPATAPPSCSFGISCSNNINDDANDISRNGVKDEAFSTSSGFSSENYSADDYFDGEEEEEDMEDLDNNSIDSSTTSSHDEDNTAPNEDCELRRPDINSHEVRSISTTGRLKHRVAIVRNRFKNTSSQNQDTHNIPTTTSTAPESTNAAEQPRRVSSRVKRRKSLS